MHHFVLPIQQTSLPIPHSTPRQERCIPRVQVQPEASIAKRQKTSWPKQIIQIPTVRFLRAGKHAISDERHRLLQFQVQKFV
jgi:hypothetical protein